MLHKAIKFLLNIGEWGYFFLVIFFPQHSIYILVAFLTYFFLSLLEFWAFLQERKSLEEEVKKLNVIDESIKQFYLPALFLFFYLIFGTKTDLLIAFYLAVQSVIKAFGLMMKKMVVER